MLKVNENDKWSAGLFNKKTHIYSDRNYDRLLVENFWDILYFIWPECSVKHFSNEWRHISIINQLFLEKNWTGIKRNLFNYWHILSFNIDSRPLFHIRSFILGFVEIGKQIVAVLCSSSRRDLHISARNLHGDWICEVKSQLVSLLVTHYFCQELFIKNNFLKISAETLCVLSC
jgi:hypothetical protein